MHPHVCALPRNVPSACGAASAARLPLSWWLMNRSCTSAVMIAQDFAASPASCWAKRLLRVLQNKLAAGVLSVNPLSTRQRDSAVVVRG